MESAATAMFGNPTSDIIWYRTIGPDCTPSPYCRCRSSPGIVQRSLTYIPPLDDSGTKEILSTCDTMGLLITKACVFMDCLVKWLLWRIANNALMVPIIQLLRYPSRRSSPETVGLQNGLSGISLWVLMSHNMLKPPPSGIDKIFYVYVG